MTSQFTLRSTRINDPNGQKLLAARDKIVANEGPALKLLQELPNNTLPTRILVEGEEQNIRLLLAEYDLALVIEPNKRIEPI